jgi:hypothetical protein
VKNCLSVSSQADIPAAKECAPIVLLALKVLADLRTWVDEYPQLAAVPLEAMAMSTAIISPWRSHTELRLPARMCIWTYALDNHVEQDIDDVTELDDVLARCRMIVCDGGVDRSTQLLSALSDWQNDLHRNALYPALASVWQEKFEMDLQGIRYDWIAGRVHTHERRTRVEDYVAHADSILVGMTHLPRWITSDQHDIVDHLNVMLPALSDTAVAIRLANDLATFSWESRQEHQNNILMYDGVSPDWVRTEIARITTSVIQQLAPLSERHYLPAVEMVRLIDWGTAFYALADFRGWGSDMPTTTAGGET